MLKHFLIRDFKDLQIFWLFVTGIFCFGAIISMFLPLKAVRVIPLGLAYLLFIASSLPVTHILGSNWRTQHTLSRQYLLALPVSHERLFIIQQIRLGIFSLPWVLALIFLPLYYTLNNYNLILLPIFAFLFFANLSATFFFYIHFLIMMTLLAERFTSHKTQTERIQQGVYTLLGFISIYFVIIVSWTPYVLFFKEIGICLPLFFILFKQLGGFLLLLLLVIPVYIFNKKNWCKS